MSDGLRRACHYLPPELIEWLADYAHVRGITRSAALRQMLEIVRSRMDSLTDPDREKRPPTASQ
jgi:hypothetical protein